MNRSPSLSAKREASPSPPSPNPSALRRWVLAFCVIRFDLEQGQTVEELYPPDSLPSDLQLLVAFSSFPDSMSHHHPRHRSSIHDSIFSFRFPAGGAFIYGYVFNRQRQDERLPRGGEQKSVVVLSHYPYSSVFRLLLQILGPLCFDIGRAALDLVASHVAAWPPPSPGSPMDLPIGTAALRVHLPPSPDDLAAAPFPLANPSVPHGLFHDADLFAAFRGLLLHLWTLWELMLLGEPILVIAPTPPQCSEAVAALVSLVAPLRYSVDFRPYFTIHDPDFARLNSLHEGDAFPPMVLGVTNLFFLKSLKNIPHVVSVGSPSPNSTRVLPVASISPSIGTGRNTRPGRLNLEKLSLNKFSPSSLLNAVKRRREGPLCLMTEHKEAVWSTYSATMKPDTAVLNRLIDAGMSPRIEESMSVVNNEILRRHFLELTTNFLAPFGPYLRATTPSEGSSPFVEPPPLPPFHADEFLNGLAARGPGKFLTKRMRSNWLDLYRRFLEGYNFMPWFQRKRAAVEKEQCRLWRQARINIDIHKLLSKMSEVEIVDSFNAIERHLIEEIQSQQSGGGSADSTVACQKLKGYLQAVFNVLPKDMQQLLLFNPKRAALLQGNPEPNKVPGHPSVHSALVSETNLSFLPL
ncbi:protein DENND6B isoform X1 [Phoenix dactylifera]|uniref:Protein DENND6B isoform X1 n=2 Tax=Phoenix dactylifera TaxID=42345 RepID=A0A8B7BFY7_PHODC|nr:protein DENND6B isoform X1 [Phoenix dactylifera]